jgi:hypothetical protein
MEVVPSIADLDDALTAWRRAVAEKDRAVIQRDRAMIRARRRLDSARGGLTQSRWVRLVSGSVAINTPRDSQAVNTALRRRASVELAEAYLAEVDAATAANIRAVDADLSSAAGRLMVFGLLSSRLTGCSLTELRRLARSRVGSSMSGLTTSKWRNPR